LWPVNGAPITLKCSNSSTIICTSTTCPANCLREFLRVAYGEILANHRSGAGKQELAKRGRGERRGTGAGEAASVPIIRDAYDDEGGGFVDLRCGASNCAPCAAREVPGQVLQALIRWTTREFEGTTARHFDSYGCRSAAGLLVRATERTMVRRPWGSSADKRTWRRCARPFGGHVARCWSSRTAQRPHGGRAATATGRAATTGSHSRGPVGFESAVLNVSSGDPGHPVATRR
jgi:hypothetical protein